MPSVFVEHTVFKGMVKGWGGRVSPDLDLRVGRQESECPLEPAV